MDFGDDEEIGPSRGPSAGLGAGVESSLLSESLALKAFLRLKREERKRQSTGNLNIFHSTPSPLSKDRSHYSLSYDPESHSANNESFVCDDCEERKGSALKLMTLPFGGSGEEKSVNRSFSSMHAIINESFQEKIDYQRKLREQQSELLALKDKLHHLQVENARLTQSTIRLNQRQLPLAFLQVMKIRRRSKLQLALRKWIQYHNHLNTELFHEFEAKWSLERSHWQQHEHIISKKLLFSSVRNLQHAIGKVLSGQYRHYFQKWKYVITIHYSKLLKFEALVKKKHFLIVCEKSLHFWRTKFIRNTSFCQHLGHLDCKRLLRRFDKYFRKWKCVYLFYRKLSRFRLLLVKGYIDLTQFAFQKWKNGTIVRHQLIRQKMKVFAYQNKLLRYRSLAFAFQKWMKYIQSLFHHLSQLRLLDQSTSFQLKAQYFRQWEDFLRGRCNLKRVFNRLNSYLKETKLMTFQIAWRRWRLFVVHVLRISEQDVLIQRLSDLQHESHILSKKYHHLEQTTSQSKRMLLSRVHLVFSTVVRLAVAHFRRYSLRASWSVWKKQMFASSHARTRKVMNCLQSLSHFWNRICFFHVQQYFDRWKLHATITHHRLTSIGLSFTQNFFEKWKKFLLHQRIYRRNAKISVNILSSMSSKKLKSYMHQLWHRWKHVNFLFNTFSRLLRRYVSVVEKVQLKACLNKWRRLAIFNELTLLKGARTELLVVAGEFQRFQEHVNGKHLLQKYYLLWKAEIRRSKHVQKYISMFLDKNHYSEKLNAFSKWKRFMRSIQYFEKGVSLLIKRHLHSRKDQLRKYFGIWISSTMNTTKSELQHLHRTSNDLAERYNILSGQYEELLQLYQSNLNQLKDMEVASQSKELFMHEIISSSQNRLLLSKCWHRLKANRSHRRKLKRDVLQMLFKVHSKMEQLGLRVCFGRWKHHAFVRFPLVKRVVSRCLWKWEYHRVSDLFKRWKVISGLERIRIEHDLKQQYLHNHFVRHSEHNYSVLYFQRWVSYVKAFRFCKKTIRRILIHMVHKLIRRGFSRWKGLLGEFRRLQKLRRYIHTISHKDLARSFRKWQTLTQRTRTHSRSIRRTIAFTIRQWHRLLIHGFTKWKLFMLSERDKDHHSFTLCDQFTNHRNSLILGQLFQQWRDNIFTPLHLFGEETFRSIDENLYPVCRSTFESFCVMKDCSLKNILLDTIINLQNLLPEYRVDIYPVDDVLWKETITSTQESLHSIHHLGYIPFDHGTIKSNVFQSSPVPSGTHSFHEFSLNHSPVIPFSPIYSNTPMPSHMSTSTSSPISPPLSRRKYLGHSHSFSGKQPAVDLQSVLAATHHQGHYVAIRQSSTSDESLDPRVVLIVLPLIYQNTIYAILTLQPIYTTWESSHPGYFSPSSRPTTYTELSSHHMKRMLSTSSTRFSQYIPLSIQMYYLFKDMSLPLHHGISFALHVYSLCQRMHIFKENYEARGINIQASQEDTEQVIALKKDVEDKNHRVEHLERSRLRHYKQSRKLKEEAVTWRKRCFEMRQSLEEYMSKVETFEAYNREVALLHQSMRNATLEIFGPDYVDDYGEAFEPQEAFEEPTRAFPSPIREERGQPLSQSRLTDTIGGGIRELDLKSSRRG